MSRFTQHAGGGLWYQTKKDKRNEYLLGYSLAVVIALTLAVIAVAALSSR